MTNQNLPTRLLTINNFVEEHKTFATHGGMRHIIFNSESNGFKTAIKRIGTRVLIDESEFFRCVNKINEVNNHA